MGHLRGLLGLVAKGKGKSPISGGGMEDRARPHHTVQATDRPGLWLQLAPEELAKVAVVVQVLHGSLLHVHPKGPDVQAIDRPAQPVRQLHLVEAAPGPRQQARGHRLVQGHLWATGRQMSRWPRVPPSQPPTTPGDVGTLPRLCDVVVAH